MPDPTFLLIGGQKCGTTWMARMLSQHPDVFVPDRKELSFFERPEQVDRGPAWYRAQFAAARGQRAIGECTPNYLGIGRLPEGAIEASRLLGISYDPHPDVIHDVAPQVADLYPDIRLLVILRNPVDRALSSYHHQIAMRRVSPRTSFLRAAGSQGIVSMGFYAHHLARWLEYFEREQVHIAVYEEDLVARPEAMLHAVFAHLGVDPTFRPEGTTTRIGERASNGALFWRYYAPRLTRRVLRWAPPLARLPAPTATIGPEVRQQLEALYAPDVAALERLLGRPLDCWRSAAEVH